MVLLFFPYSVENFSPFQLKHVMTSILAYLNWPASVLLRFGAIIKCHKDYLSTSTCWQGKENKELNYDQKSYHASFKTNLLRFECRWYSFHMWQKGEVGVNLNYFRKPEAYWIWFLLNMLSHSVVSNSLQPHGLQHARLPCPSPSLGVCPNSCPLNQWCHPTISSSVVLFSSCLQSFPASGSFPVIQLFISGGQSIGASALASVLSMNIQGWFPLSLTGLISL